MNKYIISTALALAVSAAIAWAQIGGGGLQGPTSSSGAPAGSNFSIQYKNGIVLGGTGPGTATQVLTSNGAGSAPTFQATAGGVTASGNYTPTLTAVANVDGAGTSTTMGPCQYMRVGSVVNVSCTATVDITTTSTFTQLGATLPVASALANAYEVSGDCVSLLSTQTQGAQIVADAANDRAMMQFTAQGGTAGASWQCIFTYTII
jgi:hypothetical protein